MMRATWRCLLALLLVAAVSCADEAQVLSRCASVWPRQHRATSYAFAVTREIYLRPWSVQVTCGSVVKLQHLATKADLHSHEVAYGSGSGQQSVTALAEPEDANSFWAVHPPLVIHKSLQTYSAMLPCAYIPEGGALVLLDS